MGSDQTYKCKKGWDRRQYGGVLTQFTEEEINNRMANIIARNKVSVSGQCLWNDQDTIIRRQFILDVVVVCNDHLDASVLEFLDSIYIRYSAVYGNDKIRILLDDLIHYLLRKAIAMLRPMRNDIMHIDLMAPEIPYEDGSRRNAVTVVVSVNKDLALSVHRIINDIDGFTHVIIKERIVPDSVILRQKLFY